MLAFAEIVLESNFVGAVCLGAAFSRASSSDFFCCVNGIANDCDRYSLSGCFRLLLGHMFLRPNWMANLTRDSHVSVQVLLKAQRHHFHARHGTL